MKITRVGVVGLGTMGSGIAEVFARSGVDVKAVEMTDALLERGRATLQGSTDRAVSRGKLSTEDRDALLGRITFTTSLDDLSDRDLVIEAIPEHLDLKGALFAQLDGILGPDAILATNTSSLSVTEISVSTARPQRVIGLHFFNPAPVQAFVEIIRTVVTDDSVVDSVVELAERLGKQPVVVGDKAGFIANALLFGYLNHAISMYEQHYASREDIDTAMKLGCGLPMGPLALLDLIGLDTAYEILDTMYKQGRDRVHAPTPLLKQMVTAGLRGRKSGRGFYTYEAPHSPTVVPDAKTPTSVDRTVGALPVSCIGVIGSGTIAIGVIEVLAKAGYQVCFVARSEASLERVQQKLTASLDKLVAKDKLSAADRDATLARVSGSTRLAKVSECDLVVEAVIEDLAVKRELFADLDAICKPSAILATSTSSLSVIDLAAATKRSEQVAGLHFFNPVPIMKLVEVIRTVSSSDATVATLHAVVDKLGKQTIECGDRAGFVVNALLFPYLNDAIRMLEVNYASADDIDLAMKRGCGYPMGPFELLDAVGLDVALEIERSLYLEYREPGWAPAPRLEHLVTAGYLGRKVGRGFRQYS